MHLNQFHFLLLYTSFRATDVLNSEYFIYRLEPCFGKWMYWYRTLKKHSLLVVWLYIALSKVHGTPSGNHWYRDSHNSNVYNCTATVHNYCSSIHNTLAKSIRQFYWPLGLYICNIWKLCWTSKTSCFVKGVMALLRQLVVLCALKKKKT